jgi:PHP family Zn ribbon phosphoesterase
MQLSFVRTVKKESGCEVQSIVEKDSGHPFNQAHIPSPEAALFGQVVSVENHYKLQPKRSFR